MALVVVVVVARLGGFIEVCSKRWKKMIVEAILLYSPVAFQLQVPHSVELPMPPDELSRRIVPCIAVEEVNSPMISQMLASLTSNLSFVIGAFRLSFVIVTLASVNPCVNPSQVILVKSSFTEVIALPSSETLSVISALSALSPMSNTPVKTPPAHGASVLGVIVGVGGTGVAVGRIGVAGAPHPTKSNKTNVIRLICFGNF